MNEDQSSNPFDEFESMMSAALDPTQMAVAMAVESIKPMISMAAEIVEEGRKAGCSIEMSESMGLIVFERLMSPIEGEEN